MDLPLRLRPVGIFDSGVGGLTILQAVRRQLGQEDLIYIADQAHIPYGPRPLEEVRSFSVAVLRYLLTHQCKLVIVACNAASAASLTHLRQVFPELPIVGMEPAVKPAAETTQSGVVGVLATPATFQGELYASVVERFANGVEIKQDVCLGLVMQIEGGNLHGPETRAILEKAMQPMLKAGIDTIVLGCTHYPFVAPLIQEIAGPEVRVIDPAPAVARQAARLLEAQGLNNDIPPDRTSGRPPSVTFFTTGDGDALRRTLQILPLSPELKQAPIQTLAWRQNSDMAWELHVYSA
jgi:glutamate racemase